jgi:hypothetical protein
MIVGVTLESRILIRGSGRRCGMLREHRWGKEQGSKRQGQQRAHAKN